MYWEFNMMLLYITGGKHKARGLNPALHLVLSGLAPCFYPAAPLSSCLTVKEQLHFTVLKSHSALWRQPWGWGGPQWKWVWHPCSTCIFLKYLFACYWSLMYRNVTDFCLLALYVATLLCPVFSFNTSGVDYFSHVNHVIWKYCIFIF